MPTRPPLRGRVPDLGHEGSRLRRDTGSVGFGMWRRFGYCRHSYHHDCARSSDGAAHHHNSDHNHSCTHHDCGTRNHGCPCSNSGTDHNCCADDDGRRYYDYGTDDDHNGRAHHHRAANHGWAHSARVAS